MVSCNYRKMQIDGIWWCHIIPAPQQWQTSRGCDQNTGFITERVVTCSPPPLSLWAIKELKPFISQLDLSTSLLWLRWFTLGNNMLNNENDFFSWHKLETVFAHNVCWLIKACICAQRQQIGCWWYGNLSPVFRAYLWLPPGLTVHPHTNDKNTKVLSS